MLFFTFCVDISKYSQTFLKKVFELLVNSIDYNIPNYKLLCYSNFHIKTDNPKIEIRKYYNKNKNFFDDKWLNLSFNKINIYKDLYDEFQKDFIWIDLDTIILFNISYIDNLKNFFLEIGGLNTKPMTMFTNNKHLVIPRNKYIQGNIWKLDIDLYHNLMKTFYEIQNKKLILRYDLQDLFNYYIHIKNNGNLHNICILGRNYYPNISYGLSVWSYSDDTHANIDGLKKFYYDNGILKSKYRNQEIHILSFTFKSLKKLWNNPLFNKLFGLFKNPQKNYFNNKIYMMHGISFYNLN